MRIEAVLIVRDEADCLEACLSAIKDVVDDIIIVDTGSIDDTRSIAKRFTKHVHTFAWCDDFAAARNAALEYCSADWVLQVDADEVLKRSPSEARAIVETFVETNPANAIGVVSIESLTEAAGAESVATTQVARLFRPDTYLYEGAIHEQLSPKGERGPTVDSGLRFAHSGYAGDAATRRAKARRNIPLLREAMVESPDAAYFPYQLGKAYFSIGFHSAAASAMEKAHTLHTASSPLERSVVIDLYTTWAYSLVSLGHIDKAVRVLEDADVSDSPDYAFARGYTFLMQGTLDRAEAEFLHARGFEVSKEIVSGVAKNRAAYHLGLIEEGKENLDAALEWYATALRECPTDKAAMKRIAAWPAEYDHAIPRSVIEIADWQMFVDIVREAAKSSDAIASYWRMLGVI